MATLLVKVWNVYLHREDGDFVEKTQIDEKNEELAKNLFYEQFDIPPQEGDYFEWEEDSEEVSSEAYKEAGMSNEIIKTLEDKKVMGKVAKLVSFTFITRVVVDENASDEEIVALAKPKIRAKIDNDELFDNLEGIEIDSIQD